ncbi:hypothetical protein PHISCL_01187 [Aspergillus sclerotialis]|uniref:Uncharacterized protein n=1 Tax=Aspergillus sclerotialis TaxID=2070753 RepID=A0A3A2ZYM0_9EURO|nr:hypothetical protein PHISCL_01187 [Aspergillus sclerotialis]
MTARFNDFVAAAEYIWAQQSLWASNNNYINVLPTKESKGTVQRIYDEEIRDKRNNILNSGKDYVYTYGRYRAFLLVDEDNKDNQVLPGPEYDIPTPPLPIPRANRNSLTHLLMTPIGIISDIVPAKITKNTVSNRGRVTYLRANDHNGAYSVSRRDTNPPPERYKESFLDEASGYNGQTKINLRNECAHGGNVLEEINLISESRHEIVLAHDTSADAIHSSNDHIEMPELAKIPYGIKTGNPEPGTRTDCS